MILVLFGPPGSGKGTQARLLSRWLQIPAVSTGDLLREEAASGSELGRHLLETLARGEYAGDEVVNQIVIRRLEHAGPGIILDGYPRTIEQADFLREAMCARQLPPAVAVHLDVPAEVIVTRLSSRRVCVRCKRVYNLSQDAAAAQGRCEDCATELTTRSDDQAEVVTQRLATYASVTAPIFAHFEVSVPVNGNQKAELVFEEIQTRLSKITQRVGNSAHLVNSRTAAVWSR